MNLVHHVALHGRVDILDELVPILPQHCRRLYVAETVSLLVNMKITKGRTLVEGIVGVRLQEEELQADEHGVDGEHRLPVLAQDVEAHIPL